MQIIQVIHIHTSKQFLRSQSNTNMFTKSEQRKQFLQSQRSIDDNFYKVRAGKQIFQSQSSVNSFYSQSSISSFYKFKAA
jgi:hypothetical protein